MAKKSLHVGTIYKRKDGRFEVKVSLGTNPNTKKRNRPSTYAETEEEAQRKLNKLVGLHFAGYNINPEKVKLSDWIDIYLRDYVKPFIKQNTYEGYETYADLYIKPILGEYLLNKLTTNDIQKFYNFLLKSGGKKQEGLSSKSIWNVHTVVKGALTQAQIEDLIIRNPLVGVKLPPKEKKSETRFLTSEEMTKYLTSIASHRLYAAFLLECVTGLRKGEILGLKWNCVNLKTGEIKIKETYIRSVKGNTYYSKPKTKKSNRTIFIPDEVADELKKHKKAQSKEKLEWGEDYQKDNLVFCSENGAPIKPDNFYKMHIGLIEKAGLGHVRFHDLRHSVASALLDKGFSLKDIAELLGHASIEVTADIYGHLTDKRKAETTKALVSLIPKKEKKVSEK